MLKQDEQRLSALADELSRTVCPDCGGTHEVRFAIKGDVVTYSTVHGRPGFNELVSNRLNTSMTRETSDFLRWLMRPPKRM